MIQRIQSVYLFASLCILVPMFFAPVAEMIYETGEIFAFNLTGFYQIEAGATITLSYQYTILALGILICALNLIAIFMYKIRVLQMRICIYNILFLAGLTGIGLFTLYSIQDVRSVSYSLPAVFPFISIILHFLAFRGIRRDDMMVLALSRLR